MEHYRITEKDFIKAQRKASREEEIIAHGKQITFRSHFSRSRKNYSRKRLKSGGRDCTSATDKD